MTKPLTPALLLSLLLTGCAAFPEVDAASRTIAGPPPALLPTEQLAQGPAPVAEGRGAALVAQAANLQRQVAP